MKPLSIQRIQEIINEKIPEGLIVAAHDEAGHHYKYTPTGQIFDSVTTQMKGVIDNENLKVWAARLGVEHLANTLTFNPEILKDSLAMAKLQEESIMQHRDDFEDAGGIGTTGHESVEKYTLAWIAQNSQPTDLNPFIGGQDSREWAILRSAVEFFNDHYFLPVASELLVCNPKDNYAGTLDCLGFVIILPENLKKCSDGGKHNFLWHTSTRDWRKRQCCVCGLNATYQFALIDYKTSNSIKKKPTYCAQVSAYNKAFFTMTRLRPDILLIVRLDKKKAKYEVIKIADRIDCYKAFLKIRSVNNWLLSKPDHAEPLFEKEIINITKNHEQVQSPSLPQGSSIPGQA